jgi:hypothetical protein
LQERRGTNDEGRERSLPLLHQRTQKLLH